MKKLGHPEEKQQTKAQTVEEEMKTHTSLNISVPIRVSNKTNDRVYTEYMLDSSSGKTNKLAFTTGEKFDPDYIVGKNSYAETGNNFFAHLKKA